MFGSKTKTVERSQSQINDIERRLGIMESIESTTALKFDSNNYTVTSNKVFWSYYSSVSCNLHPAA